MKSPVNEFLDSIHAELAKKSDKTKLVIVTGNDSADLDSIISALTYAYISQKSNKDPLTIYVPLVKVPKEDLSLRPETSFVFTKAGIDAEKLVYIDQIDLGRVASEYDARVFLVDHNRLTAPFGEDWNDRVIGILDHHIDEGQYKWANPRRIEIVGSCTSLVVLHFEDLFKQEEYAEDLSKLVLAPILVDTIGMEPSFGKLTPTDVAAFNVLLNSSPVNTSDYTTNSYYYDIEKYKSDVKGMSTRDLLRKDYKEWVVNGFRIGTSSLPWYLQGWLLHHGPEQAIADTWKFAEERNLDLEVILTSYDHSRDVEGGPYKREIGLFVKNNKMDCIKKDLENGKTPPDSRIGLYDQHDVKLSRKQIWPLIQSLIEMEWSNQTSNLPGNL
ncbi:hypothetical protein J3Q64DRAFT_1808655 [Phycomyces blakesleeanus]|uniref:DHHA2 domain-containing protein n=1 Tax=Phycomyces blakesleeanus TaxID=4837 RepID=A0ABR3B4R0_PHYBL